MSFTPTRLKTLGAAILGTLTLGACDDPVASTDLRPEGDPEVLAVLVFNDTENSAVEAATYCAPNDPKRPGKVGIPAYGITPIICPLDISKDQPMLTDAWPDKWYVRIVFDELLDPDVETLEPILDAMGGETGNFTGSLATTQPVVLECRDVGNNLVPVDYDGYYSPSGNNVTWPLGPSLVINPLDPTIVPVESDCQVTIKEIVHDKDGNAVPARDRVPFKFKIAPVSVIAVTPGEDGLIEPSAIDQADPARRIVQGVSLDFNVELDKSAAYCATPDMPACFSLTGKDGENPTNPSVALRDSQNDGRFNRVYVRADLLGDQTYTFTPPTDFKIKDKCGKESTVVTDAFDFSTRPLRLVSFNPGGGDAVAPSKKIVLTFNQSLNVGTFNEGTDFEISPPLASLLVESLGGGTQIRISGDYDLKTLYKLTIKAGASISDSYGKQTIDFAADRSIEFTTAPAITLTAQSPADGARIVKVPTKEVRIQLTFNQEILASSLDTSEYSLTRVADGTVVPSPTVVTTVTGAVRLDYPALPAGNYKFTLNAAATLTDRILPTPNVYTQPEKRVINFTVADSPPDGPAFKCLGQ